MSIYDIFFLSLYGTKKEDFINQFLKLRPEIVAPSLLCSTQLINAMLSLIDIYRRRLEIKCKRQNPPVILFSLVLCMTRT